MFCKYCGSQLPENAKFCQSCGGPTDQNKMGNNTLDKKSEINMVIPPQPVNNSTSNNTPMMNNGAKNNNNTGLLIVLIIIGICAIAVPIILSAVNKEKEKTSGNSGVNTEQKEEKPSGNSGGNNEQKEEVNTNNVNRVNYGGYTFSIPKKYQYMEYEGHLAIIPDVNTWLVMFSFMDADFDIIKTQLSVFDATLAEQYESAVSQLNTYQGTEYIVTDFIEEGTKMQMLFIDAENGKVLMTLLMPLDASVKLEDLFYIAFPIATSIK